MDRLLRALLQNFISRGALTVTTSRGTTFACGDGSGRPVAIRFASRATELGLLLDPELKLGEAFMDGSFVVERGSIADFLSLVMSQPSVLPHWAQPQFMLRYVVRRLSNSIRASARAATWRTTTTSTGGSIPSSSTPTGSIPAPISKPRTPRSTTPSSPRSGIWPPSCCSTSRTRGCSTSAAAGAASASISPT